LISRYPEAIRPWQHVLDPLAGYLILAQAMVADPNGAPAAVNFAPNAPSFRSVAELVQAFSARLGGRPGWRLDAGEHPREAPLLTLDATRESDSGLAPVARVDEALTWTADWYRAFWDDKDISAFTRRQIDVFSDQLAWPAGEQMASLWTA
jgi:CDP-glucose 4,6-dehydratase